MPDIFEKRTLRDALRVVFRRWPIFLISMLLFAIIVILWAHTKGLQYTGVAKIEHRIDPEATLSTRQRLNNLMTTLDHDLKGFPAVSEAIKRMDAGLSAVPPEDKSKDLPSSDFVSPLLAAEPQAERNEKGMLTDRGLRELTMGFMDIIRIRTDEPGRDVNLISVRFTHKDREFAKSFTNYVVDLYCSKQKEALGGELKQREKYYRDKIRLCDEAINGPKGETADGRPMLDRGGKPLIQDGQPVLAPPVGLRNRKLRFERDNWDLILVSPEMVNRRLTEIETNLRTLELQFRRAEEERNRLEKMLGREVAAEGDIPVEPAPDPHLDALRKAYTETEEEVVRLRALMEYTRDRLDVALTVNNLTEMHPEVRVLRDKMEETRRQLSAAEKRRDEAKAELPADQAVSTGSAALDTRLIENQLGTAAYNAQVIREDIARLEALREEHEQELKKSYPIRQEHIEIQEALREKEAEKKKYEDELVRIVQAISDRDLQPGVSVKVYAQDLDRPSSPALMGILGLAIFGGSAFGAGIVVLLNFLDRSISTTEEASHYFGVPVHGVIGEITTRRRRRLIRLKHYLLWPGVILILLLALGLVTYSIQLKLMEPTVYEESFRPNPVSFVVQRIQSALSSIRHEIGI